MNRSDKFPRVVDFSTHFPGPIASRHLLHLGADVIKVEQARIGDGNRTLGPAFVRNGERVDTVWMQDQREVMPAETLVHHLLSGGARSIVLDSHTTAWTEVTEALARWADVAIVGNRPKSALRLGIDFGRFRSLNPDIVYCLVTGYGLSGPWAGYPGHALNGEAYAGTIPIEWTEGRPSPREDFRGYGTTLAGIEATVGILAALLRRDRDGRAQHVHVSMWESALSGMWRDVLVHANGGDEWRNYRDLGPRYCTYRTADKKVILVCPTERHFWERFCDAVGFPDWMKSRGDWTVGADRGRAFPDEYELIQSRLATKTREEWEIILGKAEIPMAPVLDWREASESAHARENGVIRQLAVDGLELRLPSVPVSVVSIPEGADVAQSVFVDEHRNKGVGLDRAPHLGEHTEEVLRELGLTHLLAGGKSEVQ